MSKKTLELIDVLREELNAAGMCFGVDRVRDLTESVLRRVVSRTGGQTVYIRTTISSRSERMQAVSRDFDGTNAREVARRHSLSVRSVYRLVEAQRKLAIGGPQIRTSKLTEVPLSDSLPDQL